MPAGRAERAGRDDEAVVDRPDCPGRRPGSRRQSVEGDLRLSRILRKFRALPAIDVVIDEEADAIRHQDVQLAESVGGWPKTSCSQCQSVRLGRDDPPRFSN